MGFREAFAEENEQELTLGPESWQKYINETAPSGSRYEYIGDSFYQLSPVGNGSLVFKMKIKIPEDIRAVGPKNTEEFQDLIYRMQKKIEIDISEISLNNQSISIDQLALSFRNDIRHDHDKFYIIPQPFSPPFSLPVQLNGNKYSFTMERQPYASLTKRVFESKSSSIIHLKLIIDEKVNNHTLSTNYNLANVESCEEIYNQKDFISDYSTGKVDILGNHLELFTTEDTSDIKDTLDFYLHLWDIEQKINDTFTPRENITNLDYVNVKRVHCSIVNDKYYHTGEKDANFIFSADNEADIFPNKEDIETPFAIVGYTPLDIQILGKSLKLYEQNIIKKVRYAKSNPPHIKKGDEVRFDILDDKKIYRKLMFKIPDTPNFNSIYPELEQALLIERML